MAKHPITMYSVIESQFLTFGKNTFWRIPAGNGWDPPESVLSEGEELALDHAVHGDGMFRHNPPPPPPRSPERRRDRASDPRWDLLQLRHDPAGDQTSSAFAPSLLLPRGVSRAGRLRNGHSLPDDLVVRRADSPSMKESDPF